MAHGVPGIPPAFRLSRMLYLTSLALDILQAILAGNKPKGISLIKLHKGPPEWWDEQRRRWSRG